MRSCQAGKVSPNLVFVRWWAWWHKQSSGGRKHRRGCGAGSCIQARVRLSCWVVAASLSYA
jgi:hypothetical protein